MIGPLLLSVLLAPVAFESSVGTQSTRPQSSVAVAQDPSDPWPPAGVSRIGEGVTAPEITYESKPAYTAAARKEQIQGTVEMEAVVETDGTVGEVKVVRSLDSEFGLDEEAVKALKRWLFKPGKKEGVAVPVLVVVEMTFTVRK
jgi:protein TonB